MSRSRTGRLLAVGASVLACLVTSESVSANGLAAESFQYPTGALAGQNGGSGWTGAWQAGVTTGADAVVSPGLSNGNAYQVGSSTNTLREQFRTFPAVTADGSVTWLSFMLRADTIPGGSPAAAGGIGFSGSGSEPFFGLADNTGTICISQYKVGPPSVLTPAGTITSGQTLFILARMTLAAGNDTIDLWVNPNTTTPGAPNLTNTQLDFTISTLHVAAFDNAVVTVDEIRLGTALMDVVPEPVTAALLLSTAVIGIRRRQGA